MSIGLVSRRSFTLGALASAASLAACTTTPNLAASLATVLPSGFDYDEIYAAMPHERFAIPAVDYRQIDPRYLRQTVRYATNEPSGTIVVDPTRFFLYLVAEDGLSTRYGVGVGRQGFSWAGEASINRKAAWPTWTPPREMIERDPSLAQYANGMAPGLDNPLGARALYLYEDGQDTLYRIHGTAEQHSIGNAVSSGCIRMFNQDVIDLHGRTPIGTRVVVINRGNVPVGLLHDH